MRSRPARMRRSFDSLSPMPQSPVHSAPILLLRGRSLALDRPLVMGVLNVTPDSFSDGGRYLDPNAALAHALEMVEEGADLIDIGAESSRPGAEPVSETEELRRLIPVVREVCRRVSVPVSVDTTKAAVAAAAIEAGAAMVNDISAGQADPAMMPVVAEAGTAVVLMHMQGTPQTMQQAPRYGSVVDEVRDFLGSRMQAAVRAGIAADQILLDPGIGFGKNLVHNLTLLDRLDDRLMGTAAAVAASLLRGAKVVRVHDVRAMQDVVRMIHAIQNSAAR
jgi:dihydropteroate synthase